VCFFLLICVFLTLSVPIGARLIRFGSDLTTGISDKSSSKLYDVLIDLYMKKVYCSEWAKKKNAEF